MSKQESSSITGSSTRRYPRQVDCGGAQLEVSPLRTADREALAALVGTLPPHVLLLLRRGRCRGRLGDIALHARAASAAEAPCLRLRNREHRAEHHHE